MDPTRPANSKPLRKTGRSPVMRVAQTQDTPTDTAARGTKAAEVASTIKGTQEGIQAGKTQTGKLDQSRLAELKAAVQNGTYDVDIDGLAARILDDALGEETA